MKPRYNYICTDFLLEREGQWFFHVDKTWLAVRRQGAISSDMRKRPDIFKHPDPEGNDTWDASFLWRTALLFPAFKYDLDTDTFTKVDSWTQDWAKAAVRRRMINEDLSHGNVLVPTELKKMRKAIIAIVGTLPELASLPEVADFLSTSDFIETRITAHPKTAVMQVKAAKRNKERVPFFMDRNPNEVKE